MTHEIHETLSLRELSMAYPDLSVIRDRTGNIVVINHAKKIRTEVHLRKDDMDNQLIWDIMLASRREGSSDEGRTLLQIRPTSPLGSAAEVKHNELEVDPNGLIADARHGIELFRAMLTADSLTRNVMQPVAYDWLQGGDALFGDYLGRNDTDLPFSEDELTGIGLEKWDLHPSTEGKHQYFYKLLNREVEVVDQLPQIPLTISS